jgi:hexosaminidase
VGNFPSGISWCDPFKTWQSVSFPPFYVSIRPGGPTSSHFPLSYPPLLDHPRPQAYIFDPLANLTSAQAKLVLGGQQLLWTEQSGPQNLDSIVWPRAAASAEVFWTGAGRGDVRSALPRLHELGYRMRRRGVGAISLQPEWCALRPFACDLNA